MIKLNSAALKKATLLGEATRFSPIEFAQIQHRLLSTKSAIERGLRRSSRVTRTRPGSGTKLDYPDRHRNTVVGEKNRYDAELSPRNKLEPRQGSLRSNAHTTEARKSFNTFRRRAEERLETSLQANRQSSKFPSGTRKSGVPGAYLKGDRIQTKETDKSLKDDNFWETGHSDFAERRGRDVRGVARDSGSGNRYTTGRFSKRRQGFSSEVETGELQESSKISRKAQKGSKDFNRHGLQGSQFPETADRDTTRFHRKAKEVDYDYDDTTYIPKPSINPHAQKGPLAMTRTTAASEFLYGTSVVRAALKSDQRKLYRLYIFIAENTKGADLQRHEAMAKLGNARKIPVEIVRTPEWLSLMDKMSAGRPHNGCVLEASPLARKPIKGLSTVTPEDKSFQILLEHQLKEDVLINGVDTNISYDGRSRTYPLILMLDGILDPGNLGGILRSAFFLGADAVVISTHSAPLGPVTLKASAGAIENLCLLSVRDTSGFVINSQKHGWKFYAAAPRKVSEHDKAIEGDSQTHFSTSTLERPLMKHPTVIMLGGEGEGLRTDLLRKADFTVSIEGYRSGLGGVDSLNVSVAAGLLCQAFLQK